jgi:hypothetical protein
MIKIYTAAFLILAGSYSAIAQSTASTIKYKDNLQPSLVLELPNTTSEIEGTILQKLKQAGFNPETKGALFWKKNTDDGFYVFKDITLSSLGAQSLDIFFKVKNKKRSNENTLYMLVSKGNGNFVSAENDSGLWSNAQTFLNGFTENTVAFSLEQEIKDQENKVKSLQSKYNNLQSDERSLAAKIKSLQKDIENNQAKQVESQKEIDNQVKVLEEIRLKRKI